MRAGLTGEFIQELSAPSALGQYGRITPMMEHGYDQQLITTNAIDQ
jgi:hypothetical protein